MKLFVSTVVIVFAGLSASLNSVSAQEPSLFDREELRVAPSPGQGTSLRIPSGTAIVDFDISPSGSEVACIERGTDEADWVAFWRISEPREDSRWRVPADFLSFSIAWHPLGHSFFLLGKRGDNYVILRVDSQGSDWSAKTIYSTANELRRLVIAPQPFRPETGDSEHLAAAFYRIFFGEQYAVGKYLVRSVTENGDRPYQVIGPKESMSAPLPNQEVSPSRLDSEWVLPVAFHPSGNRLVLQDRGHCFHLAVFERNTWAGLRPLGICGGTITPTPNGVGWIHWVAGKPGVAVVLDGGKTLLARASEFSFESTPSSTPDGRGIVGLTSEPLGRAKDSTPPPRVAVLHYVPIDVPLADVSNAWMYLETSEDTTRLVRDGGVMRALQDDQLYQLYDSEAYDCGHYDPSTPTRPYLVTTDLFWELFGAAFDGLFLVEERERAIPEFWAMVDAANRSLALSSPRSLWAKAFAAVANTQQPNAGGDPEAALILAANGTALSPALGRNFNFGDLRPRGHYSRDPRLAEYFKAFRYLTAVAESEKDLAALRGLPADVKSKAKSWISAYTALIAPSRAPVIWWDTAFVAPAYARHSLDAPLLFPLAFGFDNEVLLSTIWHGDWPPDERIEGSAGARLAPSGLDIAAALGSDFARELLVSEIAKYPPLEGVLDDLSRRFAADRSAMAKAPDLYDRWIEALATQWADSVGQSDGLEGVNLWRVKRLQTGLASWVTLRHSTVLVNERTAAECGEGGFEDVLTRPPRGYVEPDPKTFGIIAALFDAAAEMIRSNSGEWKGNLPQDPEIEQLEPLRQGILKRLADTAGKARRFQAIAEKELRKEALSNSDYEEILYVGQAAEYNFLIFQSLGNPQLALSNPDPMPKIVDVSGGGEKVPLLEVAVGRPLEWDQVVPYFGRREIVKGSVYSFYEFTSAAPLDDVEWRTRVASRPRPKWIAPFVTDRQLACPARGPF